MTKGYGSITCAVPLAILYCDKQMWLIVAIACFYFNNLFPKMT